MGKLMPWLRQLTCLVQKPGLTVMLQTPSGKGTFFSRASSCACRQCGKKGRDWGCSQPSAPPTQLYWDCPSSAWTSIWWRTTTFIYIYIYRKEFLESGRIFPSAHDFYTYKYIFKNIYKNIDKNRVSFLALESLLYLLSRRRKVRWSCLPVQPNTKGGHTTRMRVLAIAELFVQFGLLLWGAARTDGDTALTESSPASRSSCRVVVWP